MRVFCVIPVRRDSPARCDSAGNGAAGIGRWHWRGHIPHDFDYWGYRVFPVWHPHFKVFGFWLFGIFIPVFVI
jgi:hypothetical protein